MKKIITVVLMVVVTTLNAHAFSLVTDPIGVYELRSGNAEKGLMTEIIDGTFELAQIPLEEVQEYPWAIAQNMVLSNYKDGSYPHTWSEKMQKDFIYSSEKIIDNSLKVFSLKESEIPYHNLKNLTSKKVGLVRGINYPSLLIKYLNQHAIIVWSIDEKQNVLNLIKGNIDYSISDELLGRIYLSSSKVDISEQRIKDTSLYVIFGKNTDMELIKKFDEALKQFKKSMQYRTILESYLGKEN